MTLGWVVLAIASASPGSVGVRTARCPDSLEPVLREELEAAGFSSEGSDVAQIDARCEDDAVLVRIDDRVTKKAVERTLAWESGARRERRLALQVVELLHASLAEARFFKRQVISSQVDQFLAARAPPAEPQLLVAVPELSVGAMGGWGGFGVEPAVFGALTSRVSRLELGVAVGVTVRGASLRSQAGRSLLGLVLPEALAAWPLELGAGWRLVPRVGIGALVVWANGEASLPYVPSFGSTVTFCASAGASVWKVLLPGLALGASLELSVTPFPVTVTIPQASARIGAPLLAASLGARF